MAKKRFQKWLAFCLAVSMLMSTTAMAVDGSGTAADPYVSVTEGMLSTDPETGNGYKTDLTEKNWDETRTNEDGSTSQIVGGETTQYTRVTDSEGNLISESSVTNGSETTTTTSTSDPVPGDKGPDAESAEITGGNMSIIIDLTPGEAPVTGSGSATPEVTAPADKDILNGDGEKIGEQTSSKVYDEETGTTTVTTTSQTTETFVETTLGTPVANDQGGTTTTDVTETTVVEGTTTQTTEITDRTAEATLEQGELVDNSTGAEGYIAESYLSADQKAALEAIGKDGYLGADGSLGTLKAMLVADGAEIEGLVSLTAEQANAAVQAAIAKLNGSTEAAADATVEAIAVYLSGKLVKDDSGVAAPSEIPVQFVQEISLLIGDKIDDGDDDSENDRYTASASFTLVVEANDLTGELEVRVLDENNQEVAAADIDSLQKNADGSYTMTDLQLFENHNYTFDINLKGVEELGTGTYVYKSEVEVEQPVEKQDPVHMTEPESEHSGNITGSGTFAADGAFLDTSSWGDTYTYKTLTVGRYGDSDDKALITTTQDIKVDQIAVKAGNGYVLYDVPGGILKAGTEYIVNSRLNDKNGNFYGISHVVLIGSGENMPPETSIESKELATLVAAQQNVDMNVSMTLNFAVNEVSLNTQIETGSTGVTTREEKVTKTWHSEWEDTPTPENPPVNPPQDPTDPPKDPTNPPKNPPKKPVVPPQEPEEEIEEPEVPLEELPEDDVPLEELPEDDVPLAEVPKTGDASILWFALSALSGAGLAGLHLTKKREDEE